MGHAQLDVHFLRGLSGTWQAPVRQEGRHGDPQKIKIKMKIPGMITFENCCCKAFFICKVTQPVTCKVGIA